ncbi:hypothetical protein ACVWW5_008171 [Bradyrhizobium sp. LM3.4]
MIWPSSAPTATVAPSAATISLSVPAEGRRDFDGDLVSLELHQGLVDGDGIAGLLEPAADGGLSDGFAEGRHTNFSHGLFLKEIANADMSADVIARGCGRSSTP